VAAARGLSGHRPGWVPGLAGVSELCPRLEQAGEGAARGLVPRGLDAALHGVCRCSLLLSVSSLSGRVERGHPDRLGLAPTGKGGHERSSSLGSSSGTAPCSCRVRCSLVLEILQIQLNAGHVHPSLGGCSKTTWVRLKIQVLLQQQISLQS